MPLPQALTTVHPTAPRPVPAPSSADREAVAEAHRRYSTGLRAYFVRRGVDGGKAEELAQQTWATLWGAVRAGRYDPGRAALSTFLYAIAANVWLRDRRASGRRGGGADAAAERILGRSEDPAPPAELAELLDAVRDCMTGRAGGLPEDVREVLVGLGRGESDRELARRLGVSPSTAHARRARALGLLREALSAERGGGVGEQREGRGGQA